MKRYEKIPYPRPNYLDSDLATKEMINGTFIKGVFQDLEHFRPVLDRYNVTQDKLTDMSIAKGNMSPQAYDITIPDPTYTGINEIAWQPTYKEVEDKKPEVVYDPLKRYSFVEYKPYSITYVDVPLHENIILNIPYYDEENAGLFGFKELKDTDGNVTDRFAAFCSLKDYSVTILGRVPDGLSFDSRTWVGYVKGALVMHFEQDTFVSFTLDGGVHVLNGFAPRFVNFGDYGCFAVEGNTTTYVYNIEMKKQSIVTGYDNNGDPTIANEISGRFVSNLVSSASSYTPYPFGTMINGKFYFAREEEKTNVWRLTNDGWRVEIKDNHTWKYQVMLKYDYCTDNWMNEPLKAMHYNIIKNGVFVKNKLPCSKKYGEECYFKSSDRHGDFVSSGGKLWHTYNFKHWEEVTGDAPNKFYGMWGRLWVKGRSDNIVGFMPYTFAMIDTKDPYTGDKKMAIQYDGFIFRG